MVRQVQRACSLPCFGLNRAASGDNGADVGNGVAEHERVCVERQRKRLVEVGRAGGIERGEVFIGEVQAIGPVHAGSNGCVDLGQDFGTELARQLVGTTDIGQTRSETGGGRRRAVHDRILPHRSSHCQHLPQPVPRVTTRRPHRRGTEQSDGSMEGAVVSLETCLKRHVPSVLPGSSGDSLKC